MHGLRSYKKHQLEALRKQITREMTRRYFNHRPPKYGNLNKTFTSHEELIIFLQAIKNHRVRLVFTLQSYLGLRIAEACSIKDSDIDLSQRRLWIRSMKDSIPTSLYLCDEVYNPLLNYYLLNQQEIKTSGYLFPSRAEQHSTKSRFPYMSPDYCRRFFRDAAAQVNMDLVYAESDEQDSERSVRHLHKLTTHSFRRFFIQHVHAKTGDLMLTQKLARHRNVKNTLIYLHADQEKLDEVLVAAFK